MTVKRTRATQAKTLEHGDILFFYRPRVEMEEVAGREDVQRFFMVLGATREGGVLFRMFAVGRKQMPEVRPGEAHPEERNWAINVLTTRDAGDVRRELLAREYPTATRGMRMVGAAKPVGEGRYQLLAHGAHSELAYVLELPRTPGPAQAEFEIKEAASYIVVVKNPDLAIPGFPSAAEGPAYPERLRRKFGARRWIAVDDPALLDYERTQILLLGVHAGDVEEELGIEIDEEAETSETSELFRTLRLPRETRTEPLLRGTFPPDELPASGEEVVRPAGDRGITGRTARRGPGRSRRSATRGAAPAPPRARFRCELLACPSLLASPSRFLDELAGDGREQPQMHELVRVVVAAALGAAVVAGESSVPGRAVIRA